MAEPGNPNEPEYEFENPAQAWISLVEACRIADIDCRKTAVTIMLNEAKNSHWTEELYDAELELMDDESEYGGPYPNIITCSECRDEGECGSCDRVCGCQCHPYNQDTQEYLEQDGKDQEAEGSAVDAEIAGGLPATPPAQARTRVTARALGYTCPKCGVFVPTGQCHTCHM